MPMMMIVVLAKDCCACDMTYKIGFNAIKTN